jgi:putative DNA primase/helicase
VKATTGQLYAEWQRWQESDGCQPLRRAAFGEALDRRDYPAPSNGKRWREDIGIKDTD